MDIEERQQRLSQVLSRVAESLDIPDSLFEQAVSRYETVGKWLDAGDSPMHQFHPTIYPQGSFALGTMVKPINDGDEYDIDLVCRLEIGKDNITKAELKDMVGSRLRAHGTYVNMLSEGKRCWTLKYENEFHMDILPGIPDSETLGDAILITDKKLNAWQHSNPKGYQRWFRSRMKSISEQRRIAIAQATKVNVEEIPEHRVRTPLQRCIQILKRHRDVFFQGRDDAPISILVTTLAARSYENQADLYKTLVDVTSNMATDDNLKDESGRYYVPNPTNPEENFAEKWNDDERLPKAYTTWISHLCVSLNEWINKHPVLELREQLGEPFGQDVVEKALSPFLETRVTESTLYPRVEFSAQPNNPWLFH